MISLEETKGYLRIDHDLEDALIQGMIKAAEELVESVLRFPLSEYELDIPETVKQTVFYVVSQLYEQRDSLDMRRLIESVSRILFAYRREGF